MLAESSTFREIVATQLAASTPDELAQELKNRVSNAVPDVIRNKIAAIKFLREYISNTREFDVLFGDNINFSLDTRRYSLGLAASKTWIENNFPFDKI